MKKYIFFYVFTICMTFTKPSIHIALVHIGDIIPTYAQYALVQARIFNQEATIYFVCDQKAAQSYDYKDIFFTYNITLVFSEELETTQIHHDIKSYYKASLHFRDQYWLKTVERFYYLEELIKKFDIPELFHLENDVLIYLEFSTILDSLRAHCPGIASVMKDDEHCAPGVVYIGSPSIYSHYLNYLTQQAKIRSNELSIDMKVLVDYMKKEGHKGFSPLPVVPTDYVKDVGLYRQRGGRPSVSPSWYDNNFDVFNSIFDAATLGIYFGGIDHRDRSYPGDCSDGYIYPGSMFNPSLFSYEWERDSKNRKVPFLIFKNKKYRINNLHVHSKDLHRFISY